MKKGTLILLVVVAVLALVAIWGFGQYNALVTQEESVESAWAQVENQYQRRMDLIPNLVETVKGYAEHEQSTLSAVVEARSKATALQINADELSEENLAAYRAAQGELSSALGRLMAISEAYPDLKANENFLKLQDQLEGTENRITVARNAFNETARTYKTKVRHFPTSIVASICGFDKKPYFEAEQGAEKAPVVQF